VLITEPPLNPIANREMVARVLFQEFRVPALFVANTSSLALFGSGRVTGVVVELGYNISTSVAVFEGDVIPTSLRRLDIGGKDLDLVLCKCVALPCGSKHACAPFRDGALRVHARLCRAP
jgi:actin-related protein